MKSKLFYVLLTVVVLLVFYVVGKLRQQKTDSVAASSVAECCAKPCTGCKCDDTLANCKCSGNCDSNGDADCYDARAPTDTMTIGPETSRMLDGALRRMRNNAPGQVSDCGPGVQMRSLRERKMNARGYQPEAPDTDELGLPRSVNIHEATRAIGVTPQTLADEYRKNRIPFIL